MWTDFNISFTFGFVDKLRNTEYGKIKSSIAPEFCCRTTLWKLNVQRYNVSFIHVRCISWTYLQKQLMSELPSMIVFQVISLLEPCYER